MIIIFYTNECTVTLVTYTTGKITRMCKKTKRRNKKIILPSDSSFETVQIMSEAILVSVTNKEYIRVETSFTPLLVNGELQNSVNRSFNDPTRNDRTKRSNGPNKFGAGDLKRHRIPLRSRNHRCDYTHGNAVSCI